MPKTFSAELEADYQEEVTSFAHLWQVTRAVDGVALGFTDHDADITFDDGNGEIVYKAEFGGSASAVRSSATMAVDNLEVVALLNDDAITEADLLAGRWDNSVVIYAEVNWQAPAHGWNIKKKGTLGNVTLREGVFLAEFHGLLLSFQAEVGRVVEAACDATYGDTRCGVRVDPPEWTATTAVTVRPPREAAQGSVVKASSFDDRRYECVVAGTTGETEPVWNTTIGGATVETLTADAWAAVTAFSDGDTILENGLIWEAAGDTGGSGTSGAAEPTWGDEAGDTVADNDITWTAYSATPAEWETKQALLIETTVASVTDQRTFVVNYSGSAAAALLTGGLCNFLDGENAGFSKEVKIWNPSTAAFEVELFEAAPFEISPGDAITLEAGCAFNKEACKGFDNILRFRGFGELPGTDYIISGGRK